MIDITKYVIKCTREDIDSLQRKINDKKNLLILLQNKLLILLQNKCEHEFIDSPADRNYQTGQSYRRCKFCDMLE